MAKRGHRGSEGPVTPKSVTPQQGIDLLRRQREKGTQILDRRPLGKADYQAWETVTRDCLVKAFGSSSENVTRVMSVGKYGGFDVNAGEEYWEERRADSLRTQLVIIDGLVEILETEASLALTSPAALAREGQGSAVFVVHGHDEAALNAVARFLDRVKLQVVILREQPNKGRTIIEKFVDYSNVGFAVVLLTPDDRGGPISAPRGEQKSRARQNVILELGFFLGKLERHRVCALYRDGVEIPSDYSGVAFVKFDDAGAWRLELAKELKAAGIDVDMNLI